VRAAQDSSADAADGTAILVDVTDEVSDSTILHFPATLVLPFV
jgi:hypothetical protein